MTSRPENDFPQTIILAVTIYEARLDTVQSCAGVLSLLSIGPSLLFCFTGVLPRDKNVPLDSHGNP